jgi:hypothetical protein
MPEELETNCPRCGPTTAKLTKTISMRAKNILFGRCQKCSQESRLDYSAAGKQLKTKKTRTKKTPYRKPVEITPIESMGPTEFEAGSEPQKIPIVFPVEGAPLVTSDTGTEAEAAPPPKNGNF